MVLRAGVCVGGYGAVLQGYFGREYARLCPRQGAFSLPLELATSLKDIERRFDEPRR